jgi:hypothetical protein
VFYTSAAASLPEEKEGKVSEQVKLVGVGSRIDVLWEGGWYQATVKGGTGGTISIHYKGSSSKKWDETIRRDSNRIAPLHTHTTYTPVNKPNKRRNTQHSSSPSHSSHPSASTSSAIPILVPSLIPRSALNEHLTLRCPNKKCQCDQCGVVLKRCEMEEHPPHYTVLRDV